jgi:GNAT superfamily N-acetyltransferase
MSVVPQNPSSPSLPATLRPGISLDWLSANDASSLGDYFAALSAESKRRFQPHPLTHASAAELCATRNPAVRRLVLRAGRQIIGYFILDPTVGVDELTRYAALGVLLESGRDWLFAPSVADTHQNQGLASRAMPHLIALARQAGARSLVLMGGTQGTNARAIAFYEKSGFERCGGYQTDQWNHDMRLRLGP